VPQGEGAEAGAVAGEGGEAGAAVGGESTQQILAAGQRVSEIRCRFGLNGFQ
jgi:hypothetical protein